MEHVSWHYTCLFSSLVSNHVEDVLITNSDSGSVVECVFAQYSSTTSCLLTITCENHTENLTTDCEIYLAKGSSSLLPLCKLNCSLFTVSAFDVIANGTSDIPSVIKNNISLTFTSVQPTSVHCEYNCLLWNSYTLKLKFSLFSFGMWFEYTLWKTCFASSLLDVSKKTVTSFTTTLTPTDSTQTSIGIFNIHVSALNNKQLQVMGLLTMPKWQLLQIKVTYSYMHLCFCIWVYIHLHVCMHVRCTYTMYIYIHHMRSVILDHSSTDLVFLFAVIFFGIDAALVFICCFCLSCWFYVQLRRQYLVNWT